MKHLEPWAGGRKRHVIPSQLFVDGRPRWELPASWGLVHNDVGGRQPGSSGMGLVGDGAGRPGLLWVGSESRSCARRALSVSL
jgi:hypothetical protein